jgi:O-antigen/teichoic acid export membrane protein
MGMIILFSRGIFGFLIPEYRESIGLLIWLLPGMYLFVINILLAAYFASQRLLRVNLWISFLCLAVITLLDIALIPSMGIRGAAIGNCIAYSVSGVVSFMIFKKYHPVRWSDLLLLRVGDWNNFKWQLLRK